MSNWNVEIMRLGYKPTFCLSERDTCLHTFEHNVTQDRIFQIRLCVFISTYRALFVSHLHEDFVTPTVPQCDLSSDAAGIVPSDLCGHESVAAAPLRAEPVIAGVLSQIPSESVWRQDYANCILSALLHLNNKRRTSLSEREKKKKKSLSAT